MSGEQAPTGRHVGRAVVAAVVVVVAVIAIGVVAQVLTAGGSQGPAFADDASPAGAGSVPPLEEAIPEDTETVEQDVLEDTPVGDITPEHLAELNDVERDCGYTSVSILYDDGELSRRTISRDPADAVGDSGTDEDAEETCVLDALGLPDDGWEEIRDIPAGTGEWTSPAGNDWTIKWRESGGHLAHTGPAEVNLYLYATY